MKLNKYTCLLFILLIGITNQLWAQQDSVEATPIVKLHYFSENNSLQYLILDSKLKKGKVFTPQANKTYEIFLDSSSVNKLIAKVQTDATGKAKAFIPPALKTSWDALPTHTFIVNENGEEVISDFAITKAKIELDTLNADGARSITVKVSKLEKNQWIPIKDVEMKLGIARLGGILSAGDEQTYTTDSSGTVTVELKKVKIPGDKNGNIMLTAKVDDNEFFGNIAIEKSVNWGVPTIEDNNFFNQRTLWTTRFRTPYWLLMLAYPIIFGVWGTLIYLIMQFLKIKKLGKATTKD